MTARELIAQLQAMPPEALDAELERFSDEGDGWPMMPIDGPAIYHPPDAVYRGSPARILLS